MYSTELCIVTIIEIVIKVRDNYTLHVLRSNKGVFAGELLFLPICTTGTKSLIINRSI